MLEFCPWKKRSSRRRAPFPALSKFPATSPSRIATRCWRRWPRAAAKSRAIPPPRIAAARSIACSQLGIKVEHRAKRRAAAWPSPARGSAGCESPAARSTQATPAPPCGCLREFSPGRASTRRLPATLRCGSGPCAAMMEPLRRMGARIEARDDNFAPLEIHGSALQPDSLHAARAQRAGEIGGVARRPVRATGKHRSRSPFARAITPKWRLPEFGAKLQARTATRSRITGRQPACKRAS